MLFVEFTCSSWSSRVLRGVHVFFVEFTCSSWNSRVLPGIHVFFLEFTCSSSWSSRVLRGVHVFFVEFTCSSSSSRVLRGVHMFFMEFTCSSWSSHVQGAQVSGKPEKPEKPGNVMGFFSISTKLFRPFFFHEYFAFLCSQFMNVDLFPHNYIHKRTNFYPFPFPII